MVTLLGALVVAAAPVVAAAEDWRSFEAEGWRAASDFGPAQLSREMENRREGEASLCLRYRAIPQKWFCGGVERRFEPPLDVSGAGGFAFWVYNPDPAPKRIFSFYRSGGEQYWVRHSKEPRWATYGITNQCLLPAGPGWHEITFLLDDIHGADRVNSAPDRDSLRMIEQLVIAVQEMREEERDAEVLLDAIRLLPPGAAPAVGRQADRYPAAFVEGDPRAGKCRDLLERARRLRENDDLDGALAALDEALALSPWHEATQGEVLAAYQRLSPERKDALKARYRERYHAVVRQDLPLAQGYSRLHQRLVDAWSRERPITGLRLGTQTFGVRYQFTQKTKLVETAEAIRDLGADTIKLFAGAAYTGQYGLPKGDTHSLAELVARDPSYRAVLGMPFRHILLWAYAFSAKEWWRDGTGTPEERQADYREIYDLACHLLKSYSGTGKRFYLGNWEGDWHLTGIPAVEPTEARIAGMTEWFRVRQRAVDDARRDTPHHDVGVYYYVEVNSVPVAMRGGSRLTNAVLPYTDVDYVSYSSYDTTGAGFCKDGSMPQALTRALDFIERHLPPKDLPGRRVWIGEFGFPVNHGLTPELQEQYTMQVTRAALKWGCPFILYWEVYCNEWDAARKQQNGFWLIDDRGQPQPVYHRMKRFLERASAHQAQRGDAGMAPAPYYAAAQQWLE